MLGSKGCNNLFNALNMFNMGLIVVENTEIIGVLEYKEK
jgi:hypothetical protein